MTVAELTDRLHALRNGNGWQAHCPAHRDSTPSLSIGQGDDGRILLNCHAGCTTEAVVSALGLKMRDLFARPAGRTNGPTRARSTARPTSPPPSASQGLMLADYADAKRLPIDFLRDLGLTEVWYQDRQAVRTPYLDVSGAEAAVQFRLAMDGENRFRWRKGSRPCLYGLSRLDQAQEAGYIVIAEGPSDCQTLWYHEIPAIGLPNAPGWNEAWAGHFDGIETIYVVIEPDQGGEAVRRAIDASSLRDRVRLVSLGEHHKDVSALHLADPANFRQRLDAALDRAVEWAAQERADAEARVAEAWMNCETLAREPHILDRFAEALENAGVAGEVRAGKLLFLVLCSRLLERPVSSGLKGVSSAGKNFVVRQVLQFFPESACYQLSAMSERTLAYSEEPLKHRFLVLFEAAGLHSPFGTYLVRSLVSEGRVRYETVEKTKDGLRPRLIEREGPTGLLITTTRIRLDSELETRLLSIPVTDTQEQTRAVLRTQARAAQAPGSGSEVDLTPWRALQTWLEGAERRVVIPFAAALADRIPPVATRLRRDFPMLVSLIQAHAVVHQARRQRDDQGRIVATFDDYSVVRELIGDLISEGVEVGVSPVVRETVAAVAALIGPGCFEVNGKQVAQRLALDPATGLRRIRIAIDKGYLRNLEDRKGRPARLVLGDPLPEEVELLPRVRRRGQAGGAAGR